MRLLFEIGLKEYNKDGIIFVRPSARCITIKNGLIAMVHSKKYNYYKFPGGGIDDGESMEQAVIREALEEAGLVVIPDKIKPFGYVHRVSKSDRVGVDYFLQDNFYFLCEVEENLQEQSLCDYESEEGFNLQFVKPEHAIKINRTMPHGNKSFTMLERECRVLEILIKEGYFA